MRIRCGSDQGERLTQWVIERHIRREGKQYAFWTKIGRTLAGSAYDAAATREAFWHSVAFYSFIQTFAGTAPRQSPDPEDFRASWPAFQQTVQALAPDVIVGLGTGLWDQLVPFLPERHRLNAKPVGTRTPEYAVCRRPPRSGCVRLCASPKHELQPTNVGTMGRRSRSGSLAPRGVLLASP